MRRSVLALSLGLIGVGALGCKSMKQKLRDSIQQAFNEDPNAGQVLCGVPVNGLSGVTVTNVTNAGSNSSGTGSATVTATPIPIPGVAAPPSCSGTVAFRYDTSRVGRRATFRVWDIRLTSRAGAPVVNTMAGMPPVGTPGMPGVAQMTAVGQIVTGNLAIGDMMLPNGNLADDYNIALTAGVPVTIVVRGGPSVTTPGSNLDVYTYLLQNGVELMHDDDSAGYPNSRIIFTPPTTGIYTIRVSTFGSGMRQGMYTVQTWPGANPMAQ